MPDSPTRPWPRRNRVSAYQGLLPSCSGAAPAMPRRGLFWRAWHDTGRAHPPGPPVPLCPASRPARRRAGHAPGHPGGPGDCRTRARRPPRRGLPPRRRRLAGPRAGSPRGGPARGRRIVNALSRRLRARLLAALPLLHRRVDGAALAVDGALARLWGQLLGALTLRQGWAWDFFRVYEVLRQVGPVTARILTERVTQVYLAAHGVTLAAAQELLPLPLAEAREPVPLLPVP